MSDYPSFPFYVKDWLASVSVRAMTLEQRGLYGDLLFHAWEDGGLPMDEQKLRRLVGATAAEWRRSWPVVRPKFEERDGLLINARQEDVRTELLTYSAMQSSKGSKGAAKRWHGHVAANGRGMPGEIAGGMAGRWLASASASAVLPSGSSQIEEPSGSVNGAHPAPSSSPPEQAELRLKSPRSRAARKTAFTPGETLAFIKRFQAAYAEHRRQSYGNPEPREWKHAKDLLAQYGVDRLAIMAERFITEPSTEYPFNGGRTITELFAHRRLIEGRLIEGGYLEPSAPTSQGGA